MITTIKSFKDIKIDAICVFCGSRPGKSKEFTEVARTTGRMIANAGKRLVFGAGGLGLMGETAMAALEAGGKVTGVVPDFLKRREIPVPEMDELLITDTMHTRKKIMYDRSDAFIILPGGLGTLDELAEIVTWFQLELHNKPVFLVNTLNYWKPMVTLLQNMAEHGFVDPLALEYFTVVDRPEQIAELLELGA